MDLSVTVHSCCGLPYFSGLCRKSIGCVLTSPARDDGLRSRRNFPFPPSCGAVRRASSTWASIKTSGLAKGRAAQLLLAPDSVAVLAAVERANKGRRITNAPSLIQPV